MSLLFVLCEKYKNMAKNVKFNLTDVIAAKKMDAQIILATDNPMDILQYSTKKAELPHVNAYILCLHEDTYEKSIQMSRVIRSNDPQSYIIFVAQNVCYCELIIKSHAEIFDYLLTPVEYADIDKCISALYKSYNRHMLYVADKGSICIKSGCYGYKIAINELVYVESFEQKIILHTIHKKIECFGYLKDITSELNKNGILFYRCHRSYLININHIKEVNFKEMFIEMSNKSRCYLSRQKKKEIMELLKDSKTVSVTG